jgi:adenylate kinase family enzyme
MSEQLLKLAERFEEKLVAEAAKEKAEVPEDAKADDLTWLPEKERALIKINGKDAHYWPSNPPASITSEKIWDRAKKAVKKYWKKYKEPWAVVFDVYRKMGGKTKKGKSKKDKK